MEPVVDLIQKKILVIGASSGIGRQIAKSLNRAGAMVYPLARREDKLQELAAELEGTEHRYFCADISDPEQTETVFGKIKDEVGPLDGMVYSAGVEASLPLLQLKPEKIRKLFDVNFFGFIESVRQFARKGHFQAGARVVVISSVASFRGDKAHTAYSASKAAINASVRCLAKELAAKGIALNAVAPAMTETELLASYRESSGALSGSDTALLERQYLGLVQTEDVAALTAFLLSPAARAMTGLTIPVDCGLTTS